jgi:hypothetical protein
MILLRLRGSLGNQLFSYCFGRALAIRKKDILIIDKWPIYQYDAQSYYSLSKFNIKGFVFPLQFKYLSNIFKRFFNSDISLLSRVNFVELYEESVEKECASSKNLIIDGHWQSFRYFEKEWKILKKELTLKDDFSVEEKSLIHEIRKSNSVSIHLRRGDYLKSKDLDVLDLEYYRKSINLILRKIENPKFFIFSDDIKWVEENLKVKHAIYLKQNIQHPEKDLIVMSNAKNHIIANSTFSWWGAYLNKSKKKIVIAPKKWFVSKERNKYLSDLLPKEWLKI